MATAPNRRPTARRSAPTPTPARAVRRPGQPARTSAEVPKVIIVYKDINDIAPYEFNARDNADAIESVAKSIRQFGFLVPVVIDEDGTLIAGHTRVEAAKLLGLFEVPTIIASHLNAEQVKAFRLIDNKVASLARWDEELLAREISELASLGFDMEGYGWTPDQIDCLTSVVASDCLDTGGLISEEERQQISQQGRRAPNTTRMVLGDFTLFVDSPIYRNWAAGVREANDFNEERITQDLIRRLGILS